MKNWSIYPDQTPDRPGRYLTTIIGQSGKPVLWLAFWTNQKTAKTDPLWQKVTAFTELYRLYNPYRYEIHNHLWTPWEKAKPPAKGRYLLTALGKSGQLTYWLGWWPGDEESAAQMDAWQRCVAWVPALDPFQG